MSQNSDEEDTPAEPRRGRRKKKLSQRAVDAIQAQGEDIPGISPERALSPDDPLNSRISLPSTPRAQSSARQPNMANQSKIARLPLPKAKARDARLTADDYGLGSDQFAIYFWKTPRPKDFLDLPDYHRTWKARIDRVQKQQDIDDDADDWQGFDNSLSNRSIASCFMNCAKRAFWARKSWKEFEDEERGLSSQTVDAGGKQDPEALDNDRRMEIFEAIKIRLCEEIWLEPYVPELPKKDSKSPMPTSKGVGGNAPDVVDNKTPPNKEERAEGIVAVTRNRDGAAEPWYEGEPVNPSGIQKGIRYWQEIVQQERRQRRIVPVIGNLGSIDSNSAEEAVTGHLDLSTSDKDN